MPLPVSYTKTQFKDVPLFSAEFDPYDRGYLVVGGGGGQNRSGVANIIALLDVSSGSEIKHVAQYDLSRDEDSPQSLASLPIKDGLMTLAGINSSDAQRKDGKNEHLRTFLVKFPPSNKSSDADEKAIEVEGTETGATIRPAAKEAFFSPSTGLKAFQRLMRLSPVKSKESGSRRLGAIGTGDGQKNEIVIFNATSAPPSQTSICARITPQDGAEAIDLDLNETKDHKFILAYCTDYQVYLYSLTYDFSTQTSTPSEPEPKSIYTVVNPKPESYKTSIRCLRWLGPNHILLLLKRTTGGADLAVLCIDPSNDSTSPPRIIMYHYLPNTLVVAAQLEVCHLDADPGSGASQIIIAVAGQHRNGNAEVHVLTCDYRPKQKEQVQQIAKLNAVTVINGAEKSWHTSNIMKLSFSNFFPPRQAPHSTMSIAGTTQHVKLASVAWGGSVVVDTFALTSTPTSPSDTSEASTKKSTVGAPSVRWVLSSGSITERILSWSSVISIAVAVLVSAILLQSYLNLTGAQSLSPEAWLSPRTVQILQNLRPGRAVFRIEPRDAAGNIIPTVPLDQRVASKTAAAKAAVTTATSKIRDLLHLHQRQRVNGEDSEGTTADPANQPHILVRPSTSGTGLASSIHTSEDVEVLREHGAKKFSELAEDEKEKWVARLKEIGEWEEGMPKTLLESVFFTEFAGIVGGGIRDAVLGR